MPPDRDEETGRFSKEYPEEVFLRAVSELEMATTSKVAERVGCSYDLAYRRLLELEESGDVGKKEAGSSFIWHTKA